MRFSYFHIEWFSNTDGPGNRIVLFLQGCNLRCPWCHLPHSRETESPILFNKIRCLNCYKCMEACHKGVHFVSEGKHELDRSSCVKCGKCIEACPASRAESRSGALYLPTRSIDTPEFFALIGPQLDVVKKSGGLTISGGEALLQKSAVLEILKHCRNTEVHTAIETSLSLPLEYYQFVSEYVDCWLIGMRDAYFNNRTGGMNDGIINNIRFLSLLKKDVIVRFPVIKEYTQSEAQLERLVRLMNTGGFKYIEVMPCNKSMEHYYILGGIKPEIDIKQAFPDDSEIGSVVSYFKAAGLNTRLVT